MRRNHRALGLLAVLASTLSAFGASAQAPYEITVETVTWTPVFLGQTHAPVAYAFGYEAWDEGAAEIALPFDFRWFGRTYRTLWVYTNGFLSFQPPPSGPAQDVLRPPSLVPDPRNSPHAFIAPMWRNLAPAANPEIRSLVEGVAPNQRLVLQVSGLRPEPGTAAQRVAFQVRLEQANGEVRITYHPTEVFAPASTAAIEDAAGTLGANLLAPSATCAGSCPCTPGSCNSNNFAVSGGSGDQARSVVIRPPVAAELIGTVEGPDGAYPGTNFNASVQVSNVGLGNAAASTAEVRLSADPTIDASDRLLRSVAIPALVAGATSSQSVSLLMPVDVPVARFYLGVVVDAANAVAEAIETNDTGYDPGGLVSGPDLRATIAGPLTSGPGEVVSLDLGLFSIGAPVAAPVNATIYLSTDAQWDAQDRVIHAASYALPDGFQSHPQVAVTLPADVPPAAYRWIARADVPNAVPEVDETNNVAVSPAVVTLTAPDLLVMAVEAGPLAFRGRPYPVTARLANRGGSAARNLAVCLYLSRDDQLTAGGDLLLGKSAPLLLAGGELGSARFEPSIPVGTATGAYWLGAIIDCDQAVSEVSETNNQSLRAGAITLRDAAADLVPVALEVPEKGAAGEPLTLGLVVGNQGLVSAEGRFRVVLSSNPGATLADRVLSTGAVPAPLGPAEERRLSLSVEVPKDVASGSYWLGLIVDPEGLVSELSEENNTLSKGPIAIAGNGLAIAGPRLPNAVVGVSYTWRFFAVGGTGSYTWQLAWPEGQAPLGLTFDAARAELFGTPAAAAEGSHPLSIRVSSGTLSVSREEILLVTPPTLPVSVVSGKLPPALTSEPYIARLVAVGGTPPYRWSRVSGDLPEGLDLSEDGTVGGEAVRPGAATFEVRVTDSSEGTDTAMLAIDVIDPRSSLTITTPDLPSAAVGEAYAFSLQVSGGQAPYRWKLDGPPAPGMSFDVTAGALSGTPTVAGSYGVLVEVRDQVGQLDRNAYVLRIFEVGALQIMTGRDTDHALPLAVLGQPYGTEQGPVRLEASAVGGTAPIGLRWSILDGGLPQGLVLDPETGLLTGTPATEGVSAFTVLAYDAQGDRDRATLAIEVVQPGALKPPTDGGGCGCRAASSRPSGAATFLSLLALLLSRGVWRRRGAS